ncbi:hypothetical protein [uncultured Paraglaciecola sp.]|uniref:hypothetical protein n=1 Tax=uncultured Paraglaciecola sp. TaxID=1765024 RepID=UPI0026262097|nr:hypothetical protein [uncultured Paraglaciecola sp.]
MKEIPQDLNTTQIEGHYKKHVERTYIGACDLMKPDGTFANATVKITGTHKRSIYNPGSRKSEQRVIATLEGKDKSFILNATNLDAIHRIAKTPMIDKWIGVEIMLTVEKVSVGRDKVDALRVKPPLAVANSGGTS